MARRWLALLALLVVMASGCAGERKGADVEKRGNINDLALSCMEEKYGEPFAYVRPAGDSMSGTRKLMVSCESLPEREIQVEIADFRSGNPVFMDNYLAVKYEADTRAFLKDCAESAFGTAEVFYSAADGGQSSALSGDADFVTYLADQRVSLNATVEVDGSGTGEADLEAKSIQLGQLAAGHGSRIYLTVLAVPHEKFGLLNAGDLNRTVSQNDFIYCCRVSNFYGEISVERVGRNQT